MTGLWITLGIFLFFFFIFIIPIHVTVGLTESVSVMVRVLFLKIPILPAKKKKKKKKVSDIVALVRMLLNVLVALLKRLGRNFKIRVYAYEICVASEEAAKTAVMYGAVKSLSETIFLRLQDSINFKIVKKAPVGIYVNFLEEKFKANVKIDFSISIAGVFGILFAAIGEFIRSFIKMSFSKNKNG
ncbi:MAG: hypothetical protein IJD59_08650 [Clostridia bacterium]|nr:hypothetical protein [Clostridia bacterium]